MKIWTKQDLQIFGAVGFFIGLAIDQTTSNLAGMAVMGLAFACLFVAMFVKA